MCLTDVNGTCSVIHTLNTILCSVIHTLSRIIQNCSLALALHPHGPCAQPEQVQVGTLTYATIQFLGSAVLVYLTCFIVARWALHKSITGQGSISIVGV